MSCLKLKSLKEPLLITDDSPLINPQGFIIDKVYQSLFIYLLTSVCIVSSQLSSVSS